MVFAPKERLSESRGWTVIKPDDLRRGNHYRENSRGLTEIETKEQRNQRGIPGCDAFKRGNDSVKSSHGERQPMRRYHHIGIPTTEAKPGETHLKHLKLFVVSHEKSEFGVEWMRFEADAAVPDLVRQVPHVAFEVTDLASELAGREILIPPNSPSDGVRVAFIVENGAPIELLEFTDPNHPGRRQHSC
jgi:hypothetical protein